MTGFSNSPRIIKGGLVLIDPDSASVRRVIALQYNPDTLTRTLQPQQMGEGTDQSEALRLKGPAVETLKLEAEIDAADQLEFPDQHQNVVQFGVAPQLAVLEAMVNPTAADMLANKALANAGTLEIAPMESPLVLFVWGANRIVPVKVSDFSITEEALLSVDDLGFDHKGGSLFMAYLQSREQLATKAATVGFDALGIGGIP